MINRILIISRSDEYDHQISHLRGQLGGSFNLQVVHETESIEGLPDLKPDYILLDSSVIYREGIQKVRRMVEKRQSEHIPIIFLSDNPEQEKLPKLLDIGISDFIFKPIDKQELLYRLKTLSKQHQHQQTPQQASEPQELVSDPPEVESSTNAIIHLYPDGRAESVNGGFEQIYGCSLDTYLHTFDHYIYSQNSDGFQWALNQFKQGEEGLTVEHQIQTHSGDYKWVQTTLTPLHDDNGKLNRIVAVETDISRFYAEKKKTEELLANLFPHEISEQLKRKGRAKSKKYKMVTVLFADFENFTTLTKTMTVDELITELNRYVRKFDEIIENHYLEKIKTMGDAYMCAGGLPLKNYSNPFDVTLASLEIQKFVSDLAQVKTAWGERPWKLRLGIHTGRVMAGVIGSKKFAYDIWGNTVNIASRMEETSQIGKVNVSGATYDYIKDYFDCTYRGKIKIKNNAEDIDMYFVNRIKPEYSEDEEGIYPNARFRKILSQY